MTSILTGAALLLITVIIIVLVLAQRQPRHFAIARSLDISAPPERLHALIDDLRQMNRWNPYVLRDPGGTLSYSGAATGKGAKFDFSGSKSGTGSVTVLDSAPDRVTMRLHMTRPFAVDNRVTFTIVPKGSATQVTWGMSGPQSLIGKVMSLFIDGDRMCGRDFEEGLGNLRRIAEQRASEAA